jgi:hypothetical protein
MSTMHDLVVSMIIIGLLILTVMRIDSNVRSNAIIARQDSVAQSNLKVISDIVQYDFRKIGHGLAAPSRSIILADTSRIIFAYDQNRRSSVFDSVRLEYVTHPADGTENPYDKLLLRKINGHDTHGVALGVTRFYLRYFNQHGTLLPTPVVADSLSKIREIELTLVVKSTEPMERRYSQSRFVTRFTPKNLLVHYGT